MKLNIFCISANNGAYLVSWNLC